MDLELAQLIPSSLHRACHAATCSDAPRDDTTRLGPDDSWPAWVPLPHTILVFGVWLIGACEPGTVRSSQPTTKRQGSFYDLSVVGTGRQRTRITATLRCCWRPLAALWCGLSTRLQRDRDGGLHWKSWRADPARPRGREARVRISGFVD